MFAAVQWIQRCIVANLSHACLIRFTVDDCSIQYKTLSSDKKATLWSEPIANFIKVRTHFYSPTQSYPLSVRIYIFIYNISLSGFACTFSLLSSARISVCVCISRKHRLLLPDSGYKCSLAWHESSVRIHSLFAQCPSNLISHYPKGMYCESESCSRGIESLKNLLFKRNKCFWYFFLCAERVIKQKSYYSSSLNSFYRQIPLSCFWPEHNCSHTYTQTNNQQWIGI